MKRTAAGFTLIELMIVVAIVALLAAIAFPAYRDFLVRSANDACLAEAKAYAHVVIAAIINDDPAPSHTAGRCAAIATPGAADVSFSTTAIDPGDATITCDLQGGNCTL